MLFKESALLLLFLISTWDIQFPDLSSYITALGCQPGKLRIHKVRGAESLGRAAKGNGNGSACSEEPQPEKPRDPHSYLACEHLPQLPPAPPSGTGSPLQFCLLSPGNSLLLVPLKQPRHGPF